MLCPLLYFLFFQQVLSTVGQSQDGGKISPTDEYGSFLLALIKKNTITVKQEAVDARVNVDELASDLRYALHEFTKALKEVERYIK